MRILLISTLLFSFSANPLAGHQQPKPADPAAHQHAFTFAAGQKVYITAVDMWGDLQHSKPDLELQRQAQETFRKQHKFTVVDDPDKADFLFAVFADPTSSSEDELGLALSEEGADQLNHGATLQNVEAVSVWHGSNHWHRGRNTAIGMIPGGGWSFLFHRESVVRDLVKQFHRDVLQHH